jgi:hypothetical protein
VLHADIEEGHVSSALAHLANISYRLGSWMPWPAARTQLDPTLAGGAVIDAFDRLDAHLHEHGVDTRSAHIRIGAELEIDPFTERLANHRAANRLLTRAYRHPFVVPSAESG